MRRIGLSAHRRRRFRPLSLTDSNHNFPVAPNLLAHRQPTQQPNTVWVADITYVPTDEGWLYVAGVVDRCTRRCIGWAFDETLATTTAIVGVGDGAQAAPTAQRISPSFRSWRAVRQRRISSTTLPGGA